MRRSLILTCPSWIRISISSIFQTTATCSMTILLTRTLVTTLSRRSTVSLKPLCARTVRNGCALVGEVEFANGIAAMAASGVYGKCRVAAGIIGHANMTLGTQIGELLDRCMEIAPNRFKGVRHVTLDYPDDRPFKFIMTYRPPAGLLETKGFPLALAELGKRKLTFDAAIYDPSLPRLIELVDLFPGLTFVLNHMGIAIGIDMTAEQKAEVFRTWSANLRKLAERPSVTCKIGELGMPNWGASRNARTSSVIKSSLKLGALTSRPLSKRLA